MRVCPRCGRANGDTGNFCDGCGAALPPASAPTAAPTTPPPSAQPPPAGYAYPYGQGSPAVPAPQPPAHPGYYPGYPSQPPAPYQQGAYALAPTGPAPRRPAGYRHRKRSTASILLTIGLVLILISMFIGWWTATETLTGNPSSTTTLNFIPGSSYTTTCTSSTTGCGGSGSSSTTSTYASSNLNHVSTIYQDVQYLLIGAVLLVAFAVVAGFLGAFGISFGRGQMSMVVAFAIIAAILCLAAAAWVAVGQPAALSSDANGSCGASPNICGSFWGSYSAAGGSETWGAGGGWYLALVGFILVIAGGAMYARTRSEPFTLAEIAQAPPPSSYPPPPAYAYPPYSATAPPPPAAYPGAQYPGAAQPPAAPPPTWQAPPAPAATPSAPTTPRPAGYCPRCGSPTAAGAATCPRCQAPL